MLPDGIRILHIRDEIDFLTNEYASLDYGTFAENRMLKLSAQKSLEIIGEASSQISAELKDKYPEVSGISAIFATKTGKTKLSSGPLLPGCCN